MTKNGTLSRLLATALLSVPLSWGFARYEHAKVVRWLADAGVEQTRYLNFLQRMSFGRVFVPVLVTTTCLFLRSKGSRTF